MPKRSPYKRPDILQEWLDQNASTLLHSSQDRVRIVEYWEAAQGADFVVVLYKTSGGWDIFTALPSRFAGESLEDAHSRIAKALR